MCLLFVEVFFLLNQACFWLLIPLFLRVCAGCDTPWSALCFSVPFFLLCYSLSIGQWQHNSWTSPLPYASPGQDLVEQMSLMENTQLQQSIARLAMLAIMEFAFVRPKSRYDISRTVGAVCIVLTSILALPLFTCWCVCSLCLYSGYMM